ncbi:recombinase family protein [Billgrantia sp. LNSP4103-1]|uniref:recombinase family protein n=1 Tax=Billgrantia sp. LNSP4103-1 TaxID=3410266 RepID=UPI00403F986B
MGAIIGYVRVSTEEQQTGAQRHAIESRYKVDRWFSDDAVSGATKATRRDGFSSLMSYIREGDTLVVNAIDRLGRDTVDVLETVERLHAEGVAVVSIREGFELGTPVGKAMLTMLAAIAELERTNIKARQMAGIVKARAEGRRLGREKVIDDRAVATWRWENSETISRTAQHFGISVPSVKRAWRRARAEGWLGPSVKRAG